MDIQFIKVPVVGGHDIIVNFMRVDTIEDNGNTITISFENKSIELNMTLAQFIDKCNMPKEFS